MPAAARWRELINEAAPESKLIDIDQTSQEDLRVHWGTVKAPPIVPQHSGRDISSVVKAAFNVQSCSGQFSGSYFMKSDLCCIFAVALFGLTSAELAAQVRGSASAVRAGGYHCTAFLGVPPNGTLLTMPGFEILAGDAYLHQDGPKGKISFYAAQQIITFQGGSMDRQAATYEIDAAGRAIIRLYNAKRSRTVIDCEGPQH